jgi:hypothetical protein
MIRFVVTEINQAHVGEWQTTDSVYYCKDRDAFLGKIKRSFELNGKDYMVRESDQTKILNSRD